MRCFLLVLVVLWPGALRSAEPVAIPGGGFVALDRLTTLSWPMAVVLEVDGERLRFSFVTPYQPNQVECEDELRCDWVVAPLDLMVSVDGDSHVWVDETLHRNASVVVDHVTDRQKIIAPLISFLMEAQIEVTPDAMTFSQGERRVRFAAAEVTLAKGAVLLGALAEDGNAQLARCYLRQLSAMQNSDARGPAEKTMLGVMRLVARMGDMSAFTARWDSGAVDEAINVRLARQSLVMEMLGGLIFAASGQAVSLDDLRVAVLADPVVRGAADPADLAAALDEATRGWEADILALRHYARWLDGIDPAERQERLCGSVLPD